MTITARWAALRPGTSLAAEPQEMVLSDPGDVQTLIDQLSQPSTSEATLIHSERPQVPNEWAGGETPDHQVTVGVRNGFGYMEFIAPGHYAQLVGHPSSPEWHTTSSDYFHPGSGVRVSALKVALVEFLKTAELPQAVTWREHEEWMTPASPGVP